MIPLEIISILILILVFTFLAICTYLYINTSRFPKIKRYEEEKSFLNQKTGKREPFPSLHDEFNLHLSVIIPAYNEETRLKPMLDECLEFLENRKKSGLTYEVIVVSDGSTDKTVQVAQNYAKKYDTLRVLELIENRGKGGAVRLGMLSARGSVLLFADADGATKFSDLDKLEDSMKEILNCDYKINPEKVANAHAVVCGSRAHLEEAEAARRSFFRLILMHGFHFLVWTLCVRHVRDTQCGFKLFTRESAKTLFDALHVERWAFDVEILYIAQTLDIPITEIAVNWTEIEGSKIIPFWSWLEMGCDLLLIWLRYKIRAWRIIRPKKL
ncbi:GSCOCG00009666001-RA-CDS [Cotesia congregata]|uniref:Dolichyl-phosphate beta-glucosyltransferase n=1 Tax=Cotesia congregata TaxID=51543 RepID=A0A8J2HQK9_COTCN|nr:GSCOCG00009666001-RA-CDS [Cotesia congregata]CAG5103149.1 Similar to wol: Dolichyl-phosphate beta-glucosyltransferase (Drosophila melanogaster) [Cotesia congregata]